MEQLSKFSRIAWMSIAGLILLNLGLILVNPDGTFGHIFPFCVDFAVGALLGGWFVILYRNSTQRSPLHRPALIGTIAATIRMMADTVLIIKPFLLWGSTGTLIYQLGTFAACILFIVAFVLLGRRSPAGKFRKAAYVAAFVPLIAAFLELTLNQVASTTMLSLISSGDGEWDWDFYNEMMRRYYICSGSIFCVLIYGAYALFAYTMDSKK